MERESASMTSGGWGGGDSGLDKAQRPKRKWKQGESTTGAEREGVVGDEVLQTGRIYTKRSS